MITGAHLLFYSRDAEADREFLRDVLEWKHVDAGEGWLIFRLPPAEAGVHPVDGDAEGDADDGLLSAQFYLLCDDLDATMSALGRKGVSCPAPREQRWGVVTTIPLPSGGALGLYQPYHPTAIDKPATDR